MKLLKRPDTYDLQKIHGEINQLVNQRFTLTTLAVTMFGVIVGWLIPKESQGAGVFVYVGAILLLLLLFALFFFSHQLGSMLRVLSTYLQVSGKSNWEDDWAKYRKRYFYMGYTKTQSVIFLLLGILATSFPWVLSCASGQPLVCTTITMIQLVLGFVYVFVVFGVSFFEWFRSEARIRNHWIRLDTQSDSNIHKNVKG